MNLDNWKLTYYVASLRSVSQTQAWEKGLGTRVVVLPVKKTLFLNVIKLLHSFC